MGKSKQWRAEAVGCPGPTRFLDAPSKIFSTIGPGKYQTTFFSRSRKNSPIRLPKFLTTFINNIVKFYENSLLGSLNPPASCPGNNIFLFFFLSYLHFFNENWPLGCPPGWMPGAVAPCAPPLHATESKRTNRSANRGRPMQLGQQSLCKQ